MTPFLGEVAIVGFNFAPVGWAFCNGQLLSISQFSALYQLIGTTYGGDGQSTFGLPNLQSRAPLHMSSENPIGQLAGVENVALTSNQMPEHSHLLNCSNSGATSRSPSGAVLAVPQRNVYDETVGVVLNTASSGIAGSNIPHNNLQPYLAVTFIIALAGIFPSQG